MNIFNDRTLKDYGGQPSVLELSDLTRINDNYRAALWTGNHMQLTVMNVKQNEDVGGEIHDHIDQMLYIVSGRAAVLMGKSENDLTVKTYANGGDAIFIPAGTWHNIINAGFFPLKMFSVYAPVQHPYGTIQKDKPEND